MTKRRRATFRESDMYGPVRDWLLAQGYTIRGEVKDCDIAARKDDGLVIVELKRQFSIELLIQATRRQSACESVYVALPVGALKRRGSRWRGVTRLLRRLELGLIFVDLRKSPPRIEIPFHPLPFQRQQRKGARRAILEEIAHRSGDFNKGGSTGRKILTAYRENAIQVACFLDKLGPTAPRQLRALGTGPKTLSILSSNFYGWFVRVEKGVYTVTAKGRAALETAAYKRLAARYRATLQEQTEHPMSDTGLPITGDGNIE